jgi:YD repeat-containing protein
MTAYKYPHNYSGNLVYDNMLSRNIITPAVEEQTYKNGDFLQSVKTNFDFWNGTNWSTTATNIIAPRTVQTQILNSAPEVRLRYQTYDDKANITAVSKENDVKLSYIWGYNKNYPIAEVVNAEAKDVFHTSFEEGDGNSSNGDCKTGRKSKVNGFSKTLTGLTNQSYKLSYWSESGSVWTLHTSTVSVSAGSYVISISGKVDEVRFCPVNAQMTTLAYDPLIGVISRCGPDNRTTYYEYDQAGRLSMVRDQNKNILKRNCYNFDGQPET